jgi:hypothetical protein
VRVLAHGGDGGPPVGRGHGGRDGGQKVDVVGRVEGAGVGGGGGAGAVNLGWTGGGGG